MRPKCTWLLNLPKNICRHHPRMSTIIPEYIPEIILQICLSSSFEKYDQDKKVLLGERKRYTVRRAVSARSAALFRGVPQSWLGRRGVPQSWLGRGTPPGWGGATTFWPGQGVGWVPHPDLAVGVSPTRTGYLLERTWNQWPGKEHGTRVPPPQVWTNKLTILPCPILQMRALNMPESTEYEHRPYTLLLHTAPTKYIVHSHTGDFSNSLNQK